MIACLSISALTPAIMCAPTTSAFFTRLVAKQFERRERGRARHGIATERARVGAGRPRHDLRSRRHHTQRQPRRNPLRHRHDVRRDAGVLDREHLARAPHPRLHFVDDEEHAELRGDLAKPLVKEVGRNHVTTLTLDRFDDDGGDFFGRNEVDEQLLFDEAQTLGSAVVWAQSDRAPVTVRHTARGRRPARTVRSRGAV